MRQNSFGLDSAAVSDRGLSEKRPQNEDSYLEMTSRGLFAVADGVGGAQAGDVASQMAVEVLQEAFTNLPENGDVEELMQLAIERANTAIYQMSHDLEQLSTMATTVVALHLEDNIATIGHVGDSRIYRIDPNGNLFRETQDHSVVEEEVRAGRMTASQAAHHPSRNVISRALGAESTVEVDMKTIMIEPNTKFLLCSDGITRHIEDHELRQLLNSEDTPAKICDDMKNICYGRGAEDNLTAVIVHVSGVSNDNFSDVEEPTVAMARPAASSNAFSADTAGDSSDVPTLQSFEMPLPENSPKKDDLDETKASIPLSHISETNQDEDIDETSPAPLASAPIVQKDEKAYAAAATKTGAPSSGKWIVPLILGLLIGSALGAFGYRSMSPAQPQVQQAVQETPKITQMQTPNIAYSAFENNRRNADKDPAQFITANGTTADDAEDYYLLGRANLLTGKYVQAKEGFTKAKELLPQFNGEDKAMLANEIAIGLSIVDSSFSKKVLETERRASTATSSQPANANTTPDTEIKPLVEDTNANVTTP